jgi:lipopolysaccharide export system permease protein
MKSLDKYIFKEMIVPYLAGFSIILVLLIGNIIYNNIDLIVSQIDRWPLVCNYILLQIPQYILLALPAGALFGASLALNRLSRDSEITVMRMAGISLKRIFVPIIIMGLMTSIVSYIFQEQIIVRAQKKSDEIIQKLWTDTGTPPIQQNVFFQVDKYFFYINSIQTSGSKTTLRNIMIYEPSESGGFPTLTTAKSAYMKHRVWYLTDGNLFRIDDNGFPQLSAKFAQMKLDTAKPISDYFAQAEISPKSMNTFQLKDKINQLARQGQSIRKLQMEYAFKMAIPLSAFVMMFCIAPLSLKLGKNGSFMGVLVGIVIYFIYWNVIWFSRILGEAGGINPFLAGWSEVIIFGILGAIFIWRVE